MNIEEIKAKFQDLIAQGWKIGIVPPKANEPICAMEFELIPPQKWVDTNPSLHTPLFGG